MIRFRLEKHEVRIALLGVALLFLVGLLFYFRDGSSDRLTGSEIEGRDGSVPEKSGDSISNPSEVLANNKIKAKVQSLLDVRKGEIGLIRIPADDFAKMLPTSSASEVDIGGLVPRVAGILSRGGVAPILESALRNGNGLPAAVGSGRDLSISGRDFRLELLEVSDKDAYCDLSIGLSDTEGNRKGQTGLSVFNGQVVLMLPGRESNNAEGVLIVTGIDPEEEE